MATYIGPLLLVLLGVGGLVIVFGRRLTVLRSSLQELPMPSEELRSRSEASQYALLKKFTRGVSGFLRIVLRILRQTGRGVWNVLRRPPVAFRVPRLALRTPSGDSWSARRSPGVVPHGLSAPASQPVQSAYAPPAFAGRPGAQSPSEEGEAGAATKQSGSRQRLRWAGRLYGFAKRIRRGSLVSARGAPQAPASAVLDGTREPGKSADHLRAFDVGAPRLTDESALGVQKDAPSSPEATFTSRGEARARLWGRRQTTDQDFSGSSKETSLAEREVFRTVSGGPDDAVASPASDSARPRVREQSLPRREEFRHDTSTGFPASTPEKPAGGKMTVEVTLTEAPEAVAREVASSVTSSLVSAQPNARRRDQRTGKRKVVGRIVRKTSDRRTEPERQVDASGSEFATAPAHEEEGDDSFVQNSGFAHAEGLLVERLAGNPRDLEAYRLLAQLYLGRNDFLQAKEVLEEALRRDPLEPSLYGPLGRAYLGLNQYSRALEMFQRAHDADERSLEYLEPLLYIAGRMDHRSLVKVIAGKILALSPEHAEARRHLRNVVPQG